MSGKLPLSSVASMQGRKVAEHVMGLQKVAHRHLDYDKAASAIVTGWRYGRKGLILYGPSGAGKTRSAWLLLRRLFDEGRKIAAFDGFAWFAAVSSAFRDMEQAESWMGRLCAVDIVFLDDIFRGKLTDAQDLALWALVERRAANGKPLIVTANATPGLLVGATPQIEPIIRRIKEFCEPVAFGRIGKEAQ
jgi:DNA replication protein DnaC